MGNISEADWQAITLAEQEESEKRMSVFPTREPIRIGVIPDVHYPHQSDELLDECLEDIRGSHIIIQIGDLADAYSLSSFNKNPARKETMQQEFDMCAAFWKRVRQENPSARIVGMLGNHEERLKRYLWGKAPELASLRALEIEKLMGLDRYGVEYYGKHGVMIHGIRFKHGDKVRAKAGYTAAAEMEDHRCTGVSGHTHRFGEANRVDREGHKTEWWEIGHLCDADQAEYIESPNWQAGYMKIVVEPDGVIEWIPVKL